ncbi:aminoglycoside phosphotransferase family protein [Streptomyces yaanensis]|uniref:Aminoglycoside phosphotransferase family protein n=1 Tax=Streptomyces yaanensis TaxID=1142239 RepID=A0ABV7SEN7_9ACTN|nr:aminoglycoside phosphotransferase family protein [Streptomyces sp. CGMCC 4.7035]WNB98382.1 aminoglycoside phosphotransferase family protein [Streptomyces sp. CGMCC 4.7035]
MTVGTPIPPALATWAEDVVGPVRSVRDISHDRPASRVWELTSASGRTVLKMAPTAKFYARETRAYREAAPALERGSVPRLLESDARHRALLLTAVPGRTVRTLPLAPDRRRAVHRKAGVWLRRFHGDARDLTPQDYAEAAREIERAACDAEVHLERAGDLIGVREREVVRRHAAALALLGPLPVGYVHGDFQERNWLYDTGAGALAVVDLERARPHAAVFDVVRLACGSWAERPELRTAFCEGFGRLLTTAEEIALRCLSALDAASAISWGVPHDDQEVVERGRRTLARLVKGEFA